MLSQTVSFDCIAFFVFCINSFLLLYYYCILRALMRILSNAHSRRAICFGIINLNIFSKTVSKQLIDTEPSLFNHAFCRYFVQNTSISGFCSNHLRWHATSPPCATLEKLTIAHMFRVRKFSSLLDQYGSSIAIYS